LSKNIKVFFAKDKILYVCEMLITKEQQEAMVDNYIKANHSGAEIMGFIDGLEAMLNLIEKLDKAR
jgi:hypothetical protein